MAGLDADGYTVTRSSEYLQQIRDEYETQTGLNIDWIRDLFLSNITTIMADMLGSDDETIQSVYDAWSPNNAAGVLLSNLSLIVGVPRQEATFSTAPVTITGTVGLVITQGKRVRGGGTDDDIEWDVTEDVTVGGGGTVDVVVRARTEGEISATPGQIDTIVTPVNGWTSVTNAAAAVPGQDRESDADLRVRREQSLQISGSTSPNALRANLLALEDSDDVAVLEAAIVLENDTPFTVVADGVTLAANSVAVIVWPDTLTAAQKALVAGVIYDLKAIGIQTNGTDVVATVTGKDLKAKEIRFDFADEIDINATATVTMETAVTGQVPPPTFADVQSTISGIMSTYLADLSVGDDVLRLEISALIAAIDGVRFVEITLARVPDPVAAQDITILAAELAIEGTGTITVTEAP